MAPRTPSVEEQLRGFFESSSIGMALASREGELLRVNRELCATLGYSETEVVGMRLLDLAHPIERAAELASFARIVAGTVEVHQRELRFVARSGEPLWVSVTASPIRDTAGDVVAIAVQIKDIRTRKTAELALKASERRFRLLALQAPIGIFETDAEGRCVFVNDRFSALTGVPAQRALGRPWSDAVHPADRTSVLGEWAHAVSLGREFVHEFRLLREDGRVVWVHATARAVKADGGDVQTFLGTLSDVTERRAVADALVVARDSAEAAARAKAEFVARMSHELRTPMNSVLGMTRLALDTALTTEQRGYLDVVHSSGRSLLRLLDDVLDFSKVGAGKLRLEPVDFDVRECVEKIVLGLAHRAAEKGLTLSCHVAEACPREVVGDSARLQQILVNLVGNAIKFTDHGAISVNVTVLVETDQEVTIQFAVTDTGIGIAAENVRAVFEPFTQADESVNRRYGGTGLGLAISSELTTLMGGRLSVETEPGQGSTFRCAIPLGRSVDLPTTPAPPLVDEPVAPARLLVVEDNAMNRTLMEAVLGRQGHEVVVVSGGQDALERLANESFDLVFMDVQMPGMSGLEAVRELRGRERLTSAHVPVVAVTAHAMPEDREKCLEAGMDAYLPKPVDASELAKAIRELVPRRTRMATPEPASAPRASEEEPFDRRAVLRRIGDDQGLLDEIGDLFRKDALDLLRRLAVHVERRDARGTSRTAHQLKGMLHNLSATPGATIARDIEHLVEGEDWDTVLRRVRDLAAEVARVEAALATPIPSRVA